VIVITVPYDSVVETVRDLAELLAGRVVVSTAVPVRLEKGVSPPTSPSSLSAGEGWARAQISMR
jgi:predicted dinucleotide-binding enzyme